MNIPIWKPEDLEQVCCDSCKRFETRGVFVRPDAMQVVECSHCGLVYLNPRPKPEHIPRFYGEDYFTKTGEDTRVGFASDYLTAENRELLVSAAETKLQLLKPYCKLPGAKCLEVGCATGEFCLVLDKHGAEPTGVDLSEFVIAQARKRYPQLRFQTGGIENISAAGSFDAVFAFELIEHVLSPSAFFQSAAKVLKPGGLLIMSTPNLDCARSIGFHRWKGFQISFEHLYFMTAETLQALGKPHGFSMISWYAGEGNGIYGEPRLKSFLRTILTQCGLMEKIRAVRRRFTRQKEVGSYEAAGSQHNLIVVMKKCPQ